MLFPQHPNEILLPQNTASRWPSHPTKSQRFHGTTKRLARVPHGAGWETKAVLQVCLAPILPCAASTPPSSTKNTQKCRLRPLSFGLHPSYL